jgi:hypothetical protein
MGRKGAWGGSLREPGAEGSLVCTLGRMGAWGGWEPGAEGSMGRKGVWGGWEPGADGSLGRMGAWGGSESGAEGGMRLYDSLMVTQITLNTEPHGFDPCQGHSYGKADMGYPGLIRSPWPGVSAFESMRSRTAAL